MAGPVALLAFWGGMAAAARAYPAPYDWRYQTISVLLYPDQNPHGHLWAWAGLELCGLAGIAWTVALSHFAESPTQTRGVRLLQLGFVCMCCALMPDGLLPLPKGHELFAIFAFLGLCLGVVSQMRFVLGGYEPRQSQDARAPTRTILGRVAPWVPLVPVALAAVTQAYLGLERPDLPWVSPIWRTRGISPILSFGLWEWICCAVLSIALIVLWHQRAGLPDRHTDESCP